MAIDVTIYIITSLIFLRCITGRMRGVFLMQAIKLQLNDEINIDESRKHLTNLHKGSEGYITVASKSPDYSQWHYKREDLLERTEDIINDITDCRQNSHFNFYKMAIFFFIKIFNDNILKIGVSLRLLDVSFHIQLANFFRFMHEKIRLTSILIFDKPLNFVYLIPCFSFASAKTRSIVSFRLL